jgi:hypothetical protein
MMSLTTKARAGLLALVIVPSLALADPWKDESRQRRYPPGWAKRYDREPPRDFQRQYAWPPYYPAPPPPYFPPPWYRQRDDDDDWREDYREWLKERREREREAYKEWRERERFKRWRERWDDDDDD